MRTTGWLLIVLAATSLAWFLASERTAQPSLQTVISTPTPAPKVPTKTRVWFGPQWDWTLPADKTFALARGQSDRFNMFTESQYRVELDSTMPVNLETPCGSEPQVLQASKECLTPGQVVIGDSRDANMGTVKAAVGVYTRNNELVNTAVAMNRVHVRLSEYKCLAHCPNGEFIWSTDK